MRLTYVGHSTTLIELDGARVLTDPLLRPRVWHLERRAAPVDPSVASQIDLVLVSHAHPDHLDRRSLRLVDSQATLVVPAGAARFVAGLGPERVVELSEGESFSAAGIEVIATHASHRGGRLLHRGPKAIGYLVAGTQRAYFAGDTDLFEEMNALSPGLDLALLPVWGWGQKLGSGHLDPERAAEALARLRPRVAVPIHWGTVYPIWLRRSRMRPPGEPPHAFARAAAGRAPAVDVRVLEPGETTTV